jgi:hypothetical protein
MHQTNQQLSGGRRMTMRWKCPGYIQAFDPRCAPIYKVCPGRKPECSPRPVFHDGNPASAGASSIETTASSAMERPSLSSVYDIAPGEAYRNGYLIRLAGPVKSDHSAPKTLLAADIVKTDEPEYSG